MATHMSGRHIPSWVAPALAALELERPTLIHVTDLRTLIEASGTRAAPNRVTQELAASGWLLPSGVRGVWVFAPADLAGSYLPADPYLTVKAARLAHPSLNIAATLESALWLGSLFDRAPSVPVVAVPSTAALGDGVRRALTSVYRVTSFAPNLPPLLVGGVPVLDPASVLVHLADSPTHVAAWTPVLDVLADLCAETNPDDVATEAAARSSVTRARLAYLVGDVRPDLLTDVVLDHSGTVRFGPANGATLRFNSHLRVADTILPRPPGAL